jgi:CRISPR-associated protein Cmr3
VTLWIIEPHDPLIVRDGRPFSAIPGAQAVSLSFPFPSTTTGGVRTRAGLKEDIFDIAMIQKVKEIQVRGPLLAELPNDDSSPIKWLIPAPGDALIFEPGIQKENSVLQRLVPLSHVESAVTDFDEKHLLLVGLPEPDFRKPSKEVPRYWHWDEFEQWLLDPTELQKQDNLPARLGHNGPSREHRMHVSMELDQRVAKEGALFGTSGLEFTFTEKQKLGEARQLALAVEVAEKEAPNLKDGIASLGGERRMVSWRKSNRHLPTCPQKVVDAIVHDRACRVFLLTPAYFEQGYYPTWLTKEHHGVTPQLAGVAIQHPQTVSGWDLEKRGPKPTRRLAPAGTVIFLNDLKGSDVAIRAWIDKIWMHCVSDDDNQKGSRPSQNRDDGFGLAVLGTWTGKPVAMKEH